MVHPGSPLDPGAGWDRPTAGVGPRRLWPVGQGNDTPPNEGVRKWRYPQKNNFGLGFSIITFWVPPCMETPKWSKVLKYVEDVFAGISPLKFNGKITFLVSTSKFQGFCTVLHPIFFNGDQCDAKYAEENTSRLSCKRDPIFSTLPTPYRIV